MSLDILTKQINELKKSKNAIILAHYYQDDSIQEISDFIGDSLELANKARATDADMIFFCGVKFMAEVAKIVNPTKRVFIPDMNAGCSLEESCQPSDFKKFKELHPNHIVISYINCSAEIKSLSDIIVTSANAESIINKIPTSQPIIFAPDKFLGGYLCKKLNRKMTLWNGSCVVHERFSEKELVKLKMRHKKAMVIAHPECTETLLQHADHIGSTSSLIKFVTSNKTITDEFIVLTEPGIFYQMKKNAPNSTFYSVPGIESDGTSCRLCNSCDFMRLNTLEKLHNVLSKETNEIFLDAEIANKSRQAIMNMFEMMDQ
jgi:quinolinate synthase